MYLKGHGTDPDLNMALKWFKMAAEQGHEKAKTKVNFFWTEKKAQPKPRSNKSNK